MNSLGEKFQASVKKISTFKVFQNFVPQPQLININFVDYLMEKFLLAIFTHSTSPSRSISGCHTIHSTHYAHNYKYVTNFCNAITFIISEPYRQCRKLIIAGINKHPIQLFKQAFWLVNLMGKRTTLSTFTLHFKFTSFLRFIAISSLDTNRFIERGFKGWEKKIN